MFINVFEQNNCILLAVKHCPPKVLINTHNLYIIWIRWYFPISFLILEVPLISRKVIRGIEITKSLTNLIQKSNLIQSFQFDQKFNWSKKINPAIKVNMIQKFQSDPKLYFWSKNSILVQKFNLTQNFNLIHKFHLIQKFKTVQKVNLNIWSKTKH